MTAVAIRGLFSRKLRTVLTMIAIVLGVSMIAGTYILTDTINNSFTQIFKTADRNIDAVVAPKSSVNSKFGTPQHLPASLLPIVRHTPGVAFAEGEVGSEVSLFDTHGKPVGAIGGAPTLLFSVAAPRFRQTSIVKGHWPRGRELVLDRMTFANHHLHLGQTLLVAGQGKAVRFTLVGTTRFGKISNFGGATTVDMPLAQAQRMADEVGKFDQIAVAAAGNVTSQQVVDRIRTRIPPALRKSVQVETSAQATADAVKEIGQALNFLTIALLAFAGIAIFVGAFIIFNTFSITVAQRTREFGLLRTLGATRAQVLRSVVLEALVVGIVASVAGLFAGIGISRLLNVLFKAFGADLPSSGLTLETRTVVVSILVGTLVTLVSSVWPAFRATRVPPIAALREGAQLPRGRFRRFVPWIAALVAVLGIAALAVAIFAKIDSTGQRLTLLGLGAVLLFLGTAMLSPQLVPPLAAVIGWPVQRFTRITGRLARENAVRNPSRTAITAAALMIGLALVGFVTIFAAELNKTASDAVNREVAGDYAVYTDSGVNISASAERAIARIPGVALVSGVNSGEALVSHGIGVLNLDGLQPATFTRVYHVQWSQGSDATLRSFGPNDALIDAQTATSHNLSLGDTLRLTTPNGKHATVTIRGIFKSSQFLPSVNIRYDTLARVWHTTQDSVVLVNKQPGASFTAVQHRIDALLKRQYPTASTHSQEQIKQQSEKSVNQLLALIYVLLGMSVVVSLFGIINTLVLSVYERTREIGMLRAIGTTRAQIRWIVRWESVITSVIGAILGLLLGVVFAVLVTSGLSSQGIEFALPVGQLLIWVAFSILFGVIAAAWPARRAARLDVLQAIAYE